jgi:hypothetical protein
MRGGGTDAVMMRERMRPLFSNFGFPTGRGKLFLVVPFLGVVALAGALVIQRRLIAGTIVLVVGALGFPIVVAWLRSLATGEGRSLSSLLTRDRVGQSALDGVLDGLVAVATASFMFRQPFGSSVVFGVAFGLLVFALRVFTRPNYATRPLRLPWGRHGAGEAGNS